MGVCIFRRRKKLNRLNGITLLLLLTFGVISGSSILGCGAQSTDAAPGTYTVPINLQLAGQPTQVVNVTVTVK